MNKVPYSVRFDPITLGALRTEAFVSGRNCNRLINDAVRLLVELKDAKRRGVSVPQRGGVEFELQAVLDRWAPIL